MAGKPRARPLAMVKAKLPDTLSFGPECEQIARNDPSVRSGLDRICEQWSSDDYVQSIRGGQPFLILEPMAHQALEGLGGQVLRVPKLRLVFKQLSDGVVDGHASGLVSSSGDAREQASVARGVARIGVNVLERCLLVMQHGGVDPWKEDPKRPFYLELPEGTTTSPAAQGTG